MPAQPLNELLSHLMAVVDGDLARRTSFDESVRRAERIAPRLPLVRRMGSRGWQHALNSGFLEPAQAKTERERAAGIARCVYFFLGSPAYPTGIVVILVENNVATDVASAFWPFDTGGLTRHLDHATKRLGDSERDDAFQRFWGAGKDLVQFTSAYLAAHFAEPLDYCRKPQQSAPDFVAYHGLVSRDGDRRAWTIEVQAHEPVSLSDAAGHLRSILVQRHQLLLDVPDELLSRTRVAADVAVGVRAEVERPII